jgi:dTDP-4-dehydrorhamnose 3,5-epimerase
MDEAAESTGASMIHGVEIKRLVMNPDRRGCFTEIFRDTWGLPIRPVQWSLVESESRVLRGMHLHSRHDEYFLLVRGRACVGLHDFRPDSPTAGVSRLIELSGEELCVLVFPPGILHGWYFYEQSVHLQSVSENYGSYHHDDNLGCIWSDPGLKLSWPDRSPILSERASSFLELGQLAALLGRHVQPVQG